MYNHYVTTLLVYSVGLVFLIYFQDPIFSVFLMMVLATYQIIAYNYFKLTYIETSEKEKARLLYKLEQTEKATVEAATQFVSLSKIIDSGLLMIDEDEKIKQVNETFEAYFDTHDIVGETYDILIPFRGLYKAVNEAYIQEIKHRTQMQYKNKYYDINISPILEDKLYKGCLVVVHDITQLKTAETFQKQFTADVSHELKTPLSAIKGISELLSNNPNMSEEERKDFIQSMVRESSRLETILSDLLIISKMDRLDYELKIEETNIKVLVDEAMHLLEPLAKNKGLNIEVSVAEAMVSVDPTKFRQVIINLIKNAINYTDKGYIKVRGLIENGSYVIEVEDSGIGIAKEDFDKVFKRFYRVDEARSRASGGSGLGLSIIKNVVKKHDGKIELTSTLKKGSCFRIELPINPEKD